MFKKMLFATLISATALSFAACAEDKSDDANDPVAGTEGGACLQDNKCNDNLECKSNKCVKAESSTPDKPATGDADDAKKLDELVKSLKEKANACSEEIGNEMEMNISIMDTLTDMFIDDCKSEIVKSMIEEYSCVNEHFSCNDLMPEACEAKEFGSRPSFQTCMVSAGENLLTADEKTLLIKGCEEKAKCNAKNDGKEVSAEELAGCKTNIFYEISYYGKCAKEFIAMYKEAAEILTSGDVCEEYDESNLKTLGAFFKCVAPYVGGDTEEE